MIPQPKPGQRGWSIESDGTVHLRYAMDHAPSAVRVATVKGAETVLDGKQAKVCRKCFPQGSRQKPNLIAAKGQKRRVRRRAAPLP